MNERTVQTAYYGIGQFFPVIVLDRRPRWGRAVPPAVPTLAPTGEAEILAVRWTDTGGEAADAEALLQQAARDAPAEPSVDRLDQFKAGLPSSLLLITLPPTALLGPWADRPGR